MNFMNLTNFINFTNLINSPLMGKDNKLHIILLGRRNSGKSSLINTLTGQNIAIVSDVAGTTTDLVKRSYEIPGFASVIFIDTAGVDDSGALGEARVAKTRDAISLADIAILVIAGNQFEEHERQLAGRFKKQELPFLIIHNKKDEAPLSPALKERLTREYSCPVIDFSTRDMDTTPVLDALKSVWHAENDSPRSLVGDLIAPGDIVLLVTPIDSEAPAGRMILPQVQMLRDILDNHATAIVLQPEEITCFLANTGIRPRLAITDSQVFKKVAALVPPRIERLQEGDRVLMLESCSHHVSCEDIGRHKIPRWLQDYTGKNFQFDFIAGLDAITRPITDYAMVIQCGGCMITGKQLKNRLQPAIEAGIPVSNYGMTIAYLHGIFHRATEVFQTK